MESLGAFDREEPTIAAAAVSKCGKGMTFAYIVVIAAIVVVVGQPSTVSTQQLEPIIDPDAYAVYAVLVPSAWARTRAKDTVLLLQQETETSFPCRLPSLPGDAEWDPVEDNYTRENSRVRLLQWMLPVDVAYRLIPRAEIEADDVRLALKYPGIWQRRPESMDFVAVSQVGFNADRTKAMVYVRQRSGGGVHSMEMRDGEWVHAKRATCGWRA